jgi:hypothetical protein
VLSTGFPLRSTETAPFTWPSFEASFAANIRPSRAPQRQIPTMHGNGGGKTAHVFCLLSVHQVDLLGAQT